MKKRSLLKTILVLVIIGLAGSLFAFSLSACDVADDEAGFQPLYTVLLSAQYTAPILLLAASPLAIDLELLEPNSTIYYLELHETSPPSFSA